ncbi:hypothetical protein G210_5770 [Candida maltosa Xu316]|uniref:Uncharacterized protein n=1 Tax=Candida maltosa (strain Xu316) TaxID=1245528 RepID=M3HPQ3_CANMX|nr:hypothetical protein G210_5770 [Candida maltosa Xu316]
MSAIIARASKSLTSLSNCATYWFKVSSEVAKTVYQKEGLQPPTLKEFETVYKKAFADLKNPQQQEKIFNQITSYKPTKESLIQYGSLAIQAAGFFAAGEIVGRALPF